MGQRYTICTAADMFKGGQIMDNAFCGGGDTNIGLSDTKTPIQESAIKMIKAAIFMGDPRYISGLPYNVGTCTAKGVSLHSVSSNLLQTNYLNSSLHDQLASPAQSHPQLNRTATPQTRTAAMATMPMLINSMEISMVKLLSRSLRAS